MRFFFLFFSLLALAVEAKGKVAVKSKIKNVPATGKAAPAKIRVATADVTRPVAKNTKGLSTNTRSTKIISVTPSSSAKTSYTKAISVATSSSVSRPASSKSAPSASSSTKSASSTSSSASQLTSSISAHSVSSSTKSASSTSSIASTSTPIPYVIYTHNPGDKAGNSQLKKELLKLVQKSADLQESRGFQAGEINFFILPLTDAQAKTLNTPKNPKIAAIKQEACGNKCVIDDIVSEGKTIDETVSGAQEEKNSEAGVKQRATTPAGVIKQRNAGPGLGAISQAPRTNLVGTKGQVAYYYDKKAANNDVTVYVIERGVAENHAEFDNIRKRIRYIDTIGTSDPEDEKTTRHGTCVLSRISGIKYGVSKQINPVIVRIRSRTPTRYIDAISKVREDIETKKIKKAVVNMSWGFKKADIDKPDRDLLYDGIKELSDAGAILLTGGGNDHKDKITEIPAAFANSEEYHNTIPGLVVVGAINVTNWEIEKESGSGAGSSTDVKANLPHVYSSGARETTLCANSSDLQGYRNTAGVSAATASASGLAAYLFAQAAPGTTGTAIKKRMIQLAWERKETPEGLRMRVIYNGVQISKSGLCIIQKRGMEARAEEACFSEEGNSTASATEHKRSHARSFEIPDLAI